MQGTAPESLYGLCESMWRPDLEPEDLFETLAQVGTEVECQGCTGQNVELWAAAGSSACGCCERFA